MVKSRLREPFSGVGWNRTGVECMGLGRGAHADRKRLVADCARPDAATQPRDPQTMRDLSLRDLFLALLLVAIWGFNFVVIKVGVGEMPPFS